MKKIIIIICLLIVPMVQAQITYREVQITDLPQLVEIYNYGLNKGGWCGLPPNEVGEYGIVSMYKELKDQFKENMSVTVRVNNSKIEALALTILIDDTLYYKAVLYDMRLPQTQWNQIIDGTVNYTALQMEDKGVKYLMTYITNNTWVYGYSTQIAQIKEVEKGAYRTSLEDYKNRGKVNYKQTFQYEIRNRTVETQKAYTEPTVYTAILDDHTYKVGYTYYVYGGPIAYKKDNTWKMISTNPEQYITPEGYYIDYLNLTVFNDGIVRYNNVNISFSNMITSSNQVTAINTKNKLIELTNNSIIFKNISNNIDYEMQLTTYGFKLNTIIRQKPNYINTDLMNDNIYLTSKLSGDIIDIQNVQKQMMTQFTAYDSKGREQIIERTFQTVNKEHLMIETIPLGWLMKEAEYPVVLDPTTIISPSDDIDYQTNTSLNKSGGWMLKFNLSSVYGNNIQSAFLNISFTTVDDDQNFNITSLNITSTWQEGITCEQLDAAKKDNLEKLASWTQIQENTSTVRLNVTGSTYGTKWAVESGGIDNLKVITYYIQGQLLSITNNCTLIKNIETLDTRNALLGKKQQIASSEHPTTQLRPVLEITYNPCIAPDNGNWDINGINCAIITNQAPKANLYIRNNANVTFINANLTMRKNNQFIIVRESGGRLAFTSKAREIWI